MPGNQGVGDAVLWKQRYRAPVVLWTRLARAAPERGLACSNRSGVFQVYAWHVDSGELVQLTDRPEGLVGGTISADGRFVYYLDDRSGDEIGHYVRVPFEGGQPQDITPGMPPYASFGLATSLAGNLAGFTLADADGFHTVCIDLGPEEAIGAPRLISRSESLAYGPFLSHGGEIGVMASTERGGMLHFGLIAVDTAGGERVGELWDGPEGSVEPVAFCPVAGDLRLLATSNRSGVKRPLMWDPRSGERTDLALGELKGEVVPLDWSLDGERILLCRFERAVQQLYAYDLVSSALTRLDHPGGTYDRATCWGPEGEILAQWQDATHPPQLIALDGETGARRRVVLAAGEPPPGRPWRSVSFPSSDGQVIEGWLALPSGKGPFPTVLHTHGGPEDVMAETFSPESQAWLDHGFAFLTINYRGSTTFGKAFQERIWGNLGRWEVEDVAAAHGWLVERGIAAPGQVLLTGWSYGGYLTLHALGRRPDLWAGAMAGIAIADWAMVYEDAADTLKGYLEALFGGTPEEKPEVYAASSPITYAEDVAAPVLIIQGRNDTRATPRQIEVYEARLRSLGKPIEVHWFDEGHMGPFAQVEPAIEHQARFIRFAQRIVAGSVHRGRRGVRVFLRGILALLSALLLVGGVSLLQMAKVPTVVASPGWPVTEGTVIASEVAQSWTPGAAAWYPRVGYRYSLDGKEYQSWSIEVIGIRDQNTDLDARRVVERYPVGEMVQVYYDPANPAMALLEPGIPDNGRSVSLAFAAGAGGGVLLLLAGLVSVLGLVRMWMSETAARRRREQQRARSGQEIAGGL